MATVMSACRNRNGKDKIKHLSRAAAEQHLYVLYANDAARNTPYMHYMEAYRCPRCLYWHVGRKGRSRRSWQEYKREKHHKYDEILVGQLIGVLKRVILKTA